MERGGRQVDVHPKEVAAKRQPGGRREPAIRSHRGTGRNDPGSPKVLFIERFGQPISVPADGLSQMNRVASRIYVADIHQAGRHQAYREHGIDAVIQLTRRRPEQGYPPGVDVYQYHMRDGPRNDITQVEAAVDRAVSLLASGNVILIHCSAGASRSAAVAAASVAVSQGIRFEEAVAQVSQARQVQIHPDVRQNAKDVYERFD